jgi:hypothetical protein
MSVLWQTPNPIVKDAFLTELVIRCIRDVNKDVRNWFFLHPLLQLIESLTVTCHLFVLSSL